MLAKLLIGGTGWDVLVPTNYTFETYGSKGLLEQLELTKLPQPRHVALRPAAARERRSTRQGSGTLYGFNKDWGTTGFTVQHEARHQADGDLEGLLRARPDRLQRQGHRSTTTS